MPTPLENICQLLSSPIPSNEQLAVELLKKEVTNYFKPLLEASNKKTITSLSKILNQLRIGKGTLKARLQIGHFPELYGQIQSLLLNDQPLSILPQWIANLDSLALSNCQLKVLPDWIGQLST